MGMRSIATPGRYLDACCLVWSAVVPPSRIRRQHRSRNEQHL